MIQDIFPSKMHIEYENITFSEALDDDLCFIFNGNKILSDVNDKKNVPTVNIIKNLSIKAVYLFSIDDRKCFLVGINNEESISETISGYEFSDAVSFEHKAERRLGFAAMTAYHLYMWYSQNIYCGKCRAELIHSDKERMLQCPDCGNLVYPRIAPAIIVSVTDGDRILLTKYKGRRYKKFALVAGFIEIGETPEDTVRREVMEETGIKVKNIRYYKSQPWGQQMNLLIGYQAELDGDDKISLDDEELSEAGWYKRDEIEFNEDDVSLTSELIKKFINE